jgi:tetratricopeptide (TPR) repeat protein
VLGALSPDEADRLLDQLAPGQDLDAEARARMVAVAAGNPLFIEQLLAAALDEAGDGVPDSIHALLAARLDALPDDEREVLEAAAACGPTFSAAAVTELLGRDARRPLEQLVRRDLLRPDDASYRSVPKQRRAGLHEAQAARLARLADERELELDELVGYHLEQAVHMRADVGDRGADVRTLSQQAARRLAAAGMRAQERADEAAARSLLKRAGDLFAGDDPERDEPLLTLAGLSVWTEERGEVPRLLGQVRAAAEARRDARLLARVTVMEHLVAFWTGSPDSAERVLQDIDRAVSVLEAAGDDRGLAEAYELQFHTLDRGKRTPGTGSPAERELAPAGRAWGTALERAVAHARRAGSRSLEAWALSWICIALPRSQVPVPEAIARATEIRDTAPNLVARASALGALALLNAQLGAFDDARRLVLENDALLMELGLEQPRAAHTIARAEVEIMAGDLDGAERLLRSGYERLVAHGDRPSTAALAWRLALVLARTRRDDEAEAFTRVAEETTPHGLWVDVWWQVIRAGIAGRAGRRVEAEALLAATFDLLGGWSDSGMHVETWIEAAGVLRTLGRGAEADDLLRRAAELAHRLGYVVSERRARELAGR